MSSLWFAFPMRSWQQLGQCLLLAAGSLVISGPGRAQAPAPAPSAAQVAGSRAPSEADAFEARVLLALSDADMVPAAYSDGRLGPAAGQDALTVATFDGRHTAPRSVQTLPLSNTVVGPPAALAVTPDGRYALSAEGRGPRPTTPGAAGTLASLPSGRTLSVVDLLDPQHPRLMQQLAGPQRVTSVSVSADGTLVALAVSPAGDGTVAPLWLYRFAQGRLSGGVAVPIPGWRAGDELVTAIFHPTQPRLALTNKTQLQLQLVDVVPSDQPGGASWQLRPWGNAVPIEAGNLLTCFSPDGRFVFANGGPASFAPVEGLYGWVLSIRLAAQASHDTPRGPVHEVVGRVRTGYTPEGLAISPDGQLLVTVNLEQTHLPATDPARTRYASLSLLSVDPASGQLRSVGDFAFDGLLPESAVFDRSSRRLAVANFGQLDSETAGGTLDFWRVVGTAQGPEPLRLVQTRRSLPVPRGAHTLAIVR